MGCIMAFTFVGPYPLIQTTTVLPNPQFGNSEGTTGSLNILRTVQGDRRTYVKSRGGRRRLQWDFVLTRNKALELLEFYRSYHAQIVFIEDHEERAWVGNIINNPFEIEMTRRGLPTQQNWPVGETCIVTIEFEGIRSQATLDSDTKQFATTYASDAQSELSLLRQNLFIETPLPTFGALQNNWDATQITGVASGSILSPWADSGPAGNNLIGRIGGVFNPTLDRSPIFNESSVIFNNRPVVSFGTVNNQFGSDTASMVTTSNMSLFPARRGTIFWVMTTVGGEAYAFYDLATRSPQLFSPELAEQQLQIALETAPICEDSSATERGVWALQDTSGGDVVEQLHFAGSSSQFTPVTLRFNPADINNDIRLATSNNGAVCALDPNIFMVMRDSDTQIRLRTNGIERSGAPILNNPGRFGKFFVNDQAWIPQFNAKIQGEWGQILVYNRRLSSFEIASVENYLSLRWGIPLGAVAF